MKQDKNGQHTVNRIPATCYPVEVFQSCYLRIQASDKATMKCTENIQDFRKTKPYMVGMIIDFRLTAIRPSCYSQLRKHFTYLSNELNYFTSLFIELNCSLKKEAKFATNCQPTSGCFEK